MRCLAALPIANVSFCFPFSFPQSFCYWQCCWLLLLQHDNLIRIWKNQEKPPLKPHASFLNRYQALFHVSFAIYEVSILKLENMVRIFRNHFASLIHHALLNNCRLILVQLASKLTRGFHLGTFARQMTTSSENVERSEFQSPLDHYFSPSN